MVDVKRFASIALTALLILQVALPAGVAVAEELPAPIESPMERSAIQSEDVATVAPSSEASPDATDSASSAHAFISPVVANRAAAPATQAVIEASLVSEDGKTTYGTLADPKASISLKKSQRFNLRIHAVFPSASDKSIEVTLPYGMQWNTNFNFDKTAGWVGELEADGIVSPNKQAGASKKPVSVYGWSSAGTLTLNFQDTTQEVTFDLPMGLAFDRDTGLATISDAITVTQNYTKEQGGLTVSKLGADITITNRPGLTTIGFQADYSKMLNKNDNVEVGLDSLTGTGHDVAWLAAPGGNEIRMLEDYFYAMLAPERAVYIGRHSASGSYGVEEKGLKVFNPGEKFTLSTGAEYTVPAGKKLYVWQRANSQTLPIAGRNASFDPMWRFPKEDFPVGSIAEISQVDVGVKYYNPTGSGSYLSYDANKLKTMRYEIIAPQEDVYVNTTMYKTGEDWPLWEGYIADNEVYLGAPGFEHTQERTLGYFTVGNRGTADSRNKTIIIDYDVNNTKIAGVTAQALPLISRKKADGTQPTQISDFKVTLWNSKTDELSDYTLDASKVKQRFRVEDVLGEHVEGMYLKHIEYKIDTIPTKTKFTCYEIHIDSNVNSGYEGTTESDALVFFGNVLTNDVRVKGEWGDNPSLFKTRIRIENTGAEEPDWHHRNQDKWDFGDGKGEVDLKYPGRSADHVTIGDTFTAFTGKSFIQGHGPVWGYHDGNLSFVVGDQLRDVRCDYFTPQWDGYAQGVQTYKAIYYISPLGDDLSFRMRYRAVGAKEAWKQAGVDSNNMSAVQPDVSEVPASDALKQVYPKAKVYKLDFSKLTSPQDMFDTRTFGPSVYWRESANAIPWAINPGYWAYTGSSILQVSFNSDPEKDVPGAYTQLMWFEYDTDTEEDLVYGSGMTKDVWDLNGDGSTEDMIGKPMGSWVIKSPTDLVVRSAAKMATQPDSSYVTYDGLAKTLIGANSTVDYRLIATNPTQTDANGVTIYWPVPKKGQNWGKAIQPNGAFQFDTFLNGGLKSQLPEGYTISYARDATPTSQALDWDGFTWTNESDTASWKQEDWDAVNFVRISSPQDRAFTAGTREEFKFNLMTRDISQEDLQKKLIDVYTPTYLRDLGSGKGYRYGQPVALTPTPGVLKGTAWVDADFDGKMDDGEKSNVISGMKLELYDAAGTLVDTATTDKDGVYEFRGLKDWSSDPSGKLDAYTIRAYNPTDPKSSAAGTFVRFSPLKDDMVMTASADQTTASVKGVTVADDRALSLNIGLTQVTKVEVKKVWIEGKNADGSEGGTIEHDPLAVELFADSAPAKDIDNAVVPAVNLSGTSATPWEASFGNLLINDPATSASAHYTVRETSVPEGYVASYAYEAKPYEDAQGSVAATYTAATVTNTRIHGSIEISKVDKEDAAKFLPNTSFELRKDGVAVREGVTNDEGILTFADVPYGEYEVVETAAPEGYVLDQTPYPAKIAIQGQVVSLTVGDGEIKGSVLITKVDAQHQVKTLSGAEFELKQGDKVVAQGTTSADGTLIFTDVVYGSYELVETKAPEGYELDQKPIAVKIEEDGTVIKLEVNNTPKPVAVTPPISILPKTGDTAGSVVPILCASAAFTVLAWALRKKERWT